MFLEIITTSIKLQEIFSFFRWFNHDIITQNITHGSIMHLYRDRSANSSLEMAERVDKESNK